MSTWIVKGVLSKVGGRGGGEGRRVVMFESVRCWEVPGWWGRGW